MLERLDPAPEYWQGKRGACVGALQMVAAGTPSVPAILFGQWLFFNATANICRQARDQRCNNKAQCSSHQIKAAHERTDGPALRPMPVNNGCVLIAALHRPGPQGAAA
jgi:hypothetical protein